MELRANNFIAMTGQKHNRLTVVGAGIKRGHFIFWECLCDCGEHTYVRGDRIRSGQTKSCGCLISESNASNKTKHGGCTGDKPIREYTIWQMMKQRCLNSKTVGYDRYGGAGIGFCEEWNDFSAFLRDMGPAPSTNHTLDRFPDRKGNYEPGNCRWATPKEQNRNRDDCKLYEFRGEIKCLPEWCEVLGLKYSRVYARISKYGWSVERAFQQE